MELIYLLGLLVALFSMVSLVLVLYADSDLVTFIASKIGKDPKAKYYKKIVWVTGASSGIGEALAKELASYGAKLVLTARRKEELERVKKECLQLNGVLKSNDILVLPLDVKDFNSHEGTFNTILKQFGKLDVFISNAGQYQRGDWDEIDLQVDRHIFDVNVFSVVSMNRIVTKYFLSNGGGQIAVVSSMAAKLGAPFASTYAASKCAVHGYFNSLRMETMGKNIDVTLICPGPVATPIFNKGVGHKLGEIVSDHPPQDMLIMSAERCAHLALVAMANGLKEAWIARLPVVPISYLYAYHPLISDLFTKFVGARMIEKMRKRH